MTFERAKRTQLTLSITKLDNQKIRKSNVANKKIPKIEIPDYSIPSNENKKHISFQHVN